MFGTKLPPQIDVNVSGGNHTHSHNHTSTTTVNEHRAPTDESIKIYNELVEKAKESLLASIKVNNNEFNFKGGIEYSAIQNVYLFHVRFSINGFETKFTHEIERHELQPMNATKIVEGFRDHLAKEIATSLTRQIFYGEMGSQLIDLTYRRNK